LNNQNRHVVSIFNLIVGSLFIIGYFVIMRAAGFFVPKDFAYLGGPLSLIPITDDLFRSSIRHFLPWETASLYWKIFLLIPGATFLSLYFYSKLTSEKISHILRIISEKPCWILFIITIFALVGILIFVFFVFQKTYFTDDENAYITQAYVILGGHALAPPPPVEKSFMNTFIITKDMLTGKYTIGYPALLAAGKWLTGTFYAAPLLMALLTVWLFFLIGKETYGKEAGVLAAILLCASPLFLFNASTFLSHTSSLFFLSFFTWSFIKGMRQNSAFWGVISGLAIGMAFHIRQLSAVGFAFPFVIWLTVRLLKNKSEGSANKFIAFCVAGFIPCVFLTAWYNRLVSGSPLVFPFNHYDPTERLGFGAMLQDLRYTHTPLKGFQNLLVSAARLNLWFLGMPASFLLLLPVLFLPKTKEQARKDKFCWLVVASYCAAYILYYSPGVPDTGPIYYFELLLPLCFIAAESLLRIAAYARQENDIGYKYSRIALAFFTISLLLGFATFYPEKALHIASMTDKIKEPYDLVNKEAQQPAIVFIHSLPQAGWVYGYRNTDPYLKAPLLFCRDLGAEKNSEVIQKFPNRHYYLLAYDSQKARSELTQITQNNIDNFLQTKLE